MKQSDSRTGTAKVQKASRKIADPLTTSLSKEIIYTLLFLFVKTYQSGGSYATKTLVPANALPMAKDQKFFTNQGMHQVWDEEVSCA